MTFVEVKNLHVNFDIYENKLPSFKDYILNLFTRNNPNFNKKVFSALKDVSLKINSGDKLGIIGKNGAGKSTLLKTICKIYSPDKGFVKTKGSIAPLLEIGAGFHPEYTGRENIQLNGSLLGFESEQIKKYEKRIIQFSEIKKFIDTPIKYYSTGMCLRLGFSIATAKTPDILIMDEMFAGGDSEFIKKASNKLLEIINSANIIILVSHDLNIIKKFCNKVIIMDKGKVLKTGPVNEMIKYYKSFL